MMHGDPGRNWQLSELARAVGMSRTTFALRFKSVTGVAPLSYLIAWRMRLAERALRDAGLPVSTLAFQLGYTSESAFSNAFKRVIGVAPNRYRAARRQNEVMADAASEQVIVAPAKYGSCRWHRDAMASKAWNDAPRPFICTASPLNDYGIAGSRRHHTGIRYSDSWSSAAGCPHSVFRHFHPD
jgi:AraC-like DNA-binding protein